MKFFFFLNLALPIIWRKSDNDMCRWGVFLLYIYFSGCAVKRWGDLFGKKTVLRHINLFKKFSFFFMVAEWICTTPPMTTCDYFGKMRNQIWSNHNLYKKILILPEQWGRIFWCVVDLDHLISYIFYIRAQPIFSMFD